MSGRKAARFMAKGYGDAGASHKRRALKGFNADSGSPQQDIDFHNYTMRQRARMLYMAAPLATSAIKSVRTNVTGQGLTLSAKVDREALGLSQEAADRWQRQTEKEFALWAESRACDALGINDFYELQQIAVMSWMMSGDVFCLFKDGAKTDTNPYDLCLHLIEADRVSTPTVWNTFFGQMTEGTNEKTGNDIHDGVEVDKSGRVVAYHISNTYPGELPKNGKVEWTRIEARGAETGLPNILHIMEAERPDQYRGVSFLAPVIEPLLQLRRYTEAEITAAQIEACFAGFLKTQAPADDIPMNETGEVGPQEPSDPNEFNFGPGEFNVLKPGEDIAFSDPKRPANGFGGFVLAIAQQVGAGLEIPAEQLLKAFASSYSASRGALLEAWKCYRMRRSWFKKDFCKPIYSVWLAHAVAMGRIQAPGFFVDPAIRKAWSGSEWAGPSQGQLNPVQEIQAEILAVQHGFSTHEQSTVRLNGGSWKNNVERLAIEQVQLEAVRPQEVNNYE